MFLTCELLVRYIYFFLIPYVLSPIILYKNNISFIMPVCHLALQFIISYFQSGLLTIIKKYQCK